MSWSLPKIMLALLLGLSPLAALAQSCSAPDATSAADCADGMEWSEASGRCLPVMS